MQTQLNEIKLRYSTKQKATDWIKISSSANAAEAIYKNWDKDHIATFETFKILLLNNSNQIKGVFQVSQGGITGTLVDVRLIFAVALKSLAVGMILTHNHPSGTLNPSEADKSITRKIKSAGEFLDIKVLDHIILTPSGKYFSFADEGIL
ncbi:MULTISPECIES: JAB domain-containing protein [Leeuwenhoekiella]|jgi:DNA repair protein RadC|uniref:JAB domain-containing protein n=2 Tax=Flavobacteriaceae TaxID=49546 RepID=UPI000C4B654A|nr:MULTISPECIES: JAB domain-containing protein [Leeuwenhoekiella]MAO43491.1 DNA repair protein [Leeuwenhoekiella sp.]MBQ51968.1 DNA repair protein [Leeuwenhoekiella sp.]HBO30144.1 DNA repair protein [Leeuwenhoekiella sp.]HBT08082.1 DNA repair protein [Leeuwenhoekiella sp.]HCQ76539.1 DNA repair protein [Leeuwenhoekiella sp.]|tara:strand:- start:27439 stop:27888 length:450 start_codon:yes stop_codon:yes gene_type:complete